MNRKDPSDWLEGVDDTVFGGSVLLLTAFVAPLLVAPDAIGAGLDRVGSMLFVWGGMGHQIVVLLAVGFVLGVLVTPLGSHRLGGPDASPEFGGGAYFAILFSAAIAAGIVFSGPGEALIHFRNVPSGVDAPEESAEAAAVAFQYTLFHWGVSVWSIYLTFAVLIAYFVYSRGAPLRVSAVLAPFLGVERLDSYPAKVVDLLGVVAPIVGTTTTVARVSQQFIAGIEHHWGVVLGRSAVVIFMLGMVVVFTVSAVTGLYRGIRRLSVINVGGFLVLGTLVFVLGPTTHIVTTTVDALGRYAVEFTAMSTETGTDWVENWTLFYWAWWLSWGPFVGLFVARISRGRTLRSLVLHGVGATAAATTAWFLTFGATSIRFVRTGQATFPGEKALTGFHLFAVLPGGEVMIFLFLALIITFLVTSADSLTLSISYLTSEHGTDPSRELRTVWGGLQAALTTVVLLVGGAGIAASAVVVVGSLVAPVLVVAIAGMVHELALFQRLRETIV